MSLVAVTVLGQDRPGIIAAVTGALADLGGNIEDSSMTLLRGHFAMTLIVAADVEPVQIETTLGPIAQSMGLIVAARTVPDDQGTTVDGGHHVLSVHGGDRPGIVSAITNLVASRGGNITDLTTRLAGELYVLVAEVDLPGDADFDALESELAQVAGGLGVEASLRAADADVL